MCADFLILNVWTVLFCLIFFFIWKCRTWYLNYWYHFHCLWFSIGYGYDTIYFFSLLSYDLSYSMSQAIFCSFVDFFSCPHDIFIFLAFSKVHVQKCTFRWNTCLFFFCLILFFATIVLEWKSNANGILTLNVKGLIWTLLFVLQNKYILFLDIKGTVSKSSLNMIYFRSKNDYNDN